MWTFLIVEIEVVADASDCLSHILIRLQIDLLVLQASPQPFDEDIVDPAYFYSDDRINGSSPTSCGSPFWHVEQAVFMALVI